MAPATAGWHRPCECTCAPEENGGGLVGAAVEDVFWKRETGGEQERGGPSGNCTRHGAQRRERKRDTRMCQRVWLTGCAVIGAALLSAGNALAGSGVQVFCAAGQAVGEQRVFRHLARKWSSSTSVCFSTLTPITTGRVGATASVTTIPCSRPSGFISAAMHAEFM